MDSNNATRALLCKCFDHLNQEIARLSLNASAASGKQALSREIAEHLDALAAQQSVPVPPEARAVEGAIARMNRACDLMGTIRTETGPVAGHEDPGAIEDCWREAFDELVQAEDSLRTCFPPSEGETKP